MRRFFKTIILALSIVFAAQVMAAFVLPYVQSGAAFCRVQPVLSRFESSDAAPLYAYDIKIIDGFHDVNPSYLLEAIINNGQRSRGFQSRQISLGYTDGIDLFGWSYSRFSYYKINKNNLVSGNPRVVNECRDRI